MGSSNNNAKINKGNTLLNIYIINSEQQILKMPFVKEIDNGEQDYKTYNHKFYGWTFYDYGKELNENIIKKVRTKIINEAKKDNFKNVVLYFASNSDNNNFDLKLLESVAEIIKQNGTSSEYYQPLILYVTYSEEKNLKYYRERASELNKDSEKYEIDELNITSFIYKESTFINELISELWQITIYFNQIGSGILPMSESDDHLEIKFEKNIFTLNFLLAGKNGTGKSTFINTLNGRKIAYQSDSGIVKTNKINNYIITIKKPPKNLDIIDDGLININANSKSDSELSTIDNGSEFNRSINYSYQITDTIGFSEDNKESKELLKCIKEFNNESIRKKDRLQCILYFLDDSDRRILSSNVEVEFLKFIFEQKIKLFFLINFNDGKNHKCKEKLITILEKKLTKEEFEFLVEKDKSNIIEVSLKKNGNTKPFGLENLLAKLENFFKNKKIDTQNILNFRNKISNMPLNNKYSKEEELAEYLKIIRKSVLFDDINNVNDLYLKLISKSKTLILLSIPILIGISFIPIPGVDDAIAISIESGLIAAIGNCFGINMTKEEIKRSFINVNFGSLKRVAILVGKVVLRVAGIVVDILKLAPPLGTIIAGAASAGVNVASIKLTGEQAISYFLDRFIKEVDYNYLINMSECYNNNIDGFTYLKNYFHFIGE